MIPTLALTAALTIAPAPPVDRDVPPSRAEVSRVLEVASLPAARWRAFAACIVQRESHGNPRAVNSSGHAGLVQFSRDWSHGLPFIVQRALEAHGMTHALAKSIRLQLPARIERWPAVYQRVAFARVLTEGGYAAAMRHWYLAGSRCNALAVGR